MNECKLLLSIGEWLRGTLKHLDGYGAVNDGREFGRLILLLDLESLCIDRTERLSDLLAKIKAAAILVCMEHEGDRLPDKIRDEMCQEFSRWRP